MLKTMWNMPAELLRTGVDADDAESGDERLASGSLKQMIEAFDEHDGGEAEAIVIKCAGRDRPITAHEIRGLRRGQVAAAEA
ncbi:hypothetical protein VH567_13375 [Sphingomonas sp. 4RDLI-65]|uniref:hypothetical protein n=1 Tax=Sphingomonas sp. 4RDLI-65 TaxID=3111641 RepID=UPI003C24532A